MSGNLSGRLLIASPYLTDGNFLRSVVFMVRHDVEGAFGLAVNRPTETRVRDVVGPTGLKGDVRDDDLVHRGGPVEGPLLALHDLAGVGEPCGTMTGSGEGQSGGATCIVHHDTHEPWGSMSIDLGNPPAWLTADDDHLRILLHRPDARVRYVAHYSGWGPGQLEHELGSGGWLVGDATPDILFGDSEDVWETATRRCGEGILRHFVSDVHPGDPERN